MIRSLSIAATATLLALLAALAMRGLVAGKAVGALLAAYVAYVATLQHAAIGAPRAQAIIRKLPGHHKWTDNK